MVRALGRQFSILHVDIRITMTFARDRERTQSVRRTYHMMDYPFGRMKNIPALHKHVVIECTRKYVPPVIDDKERGPRTDTEHGVDCGLSKNYSIVLYTV